MKLEEIADVMIGVLIKREIRENGGNRYTLFSLKNYEEGQEYEEIETEKDLNGKLAQKGDLLFRLIFPNKIIYVDEKLEGLLIPSQFCIIRIKEEKINPIVLKWYLESEMASEELKSKITGSLIKSVPVYNLKTLRIPEISKENQKNMEELIVLWKKEKMISKQILEEKDKLYNGYLQSLIRK